MGRKKATDDVLIVPPDVLAQVIDHQPAAPSLMELIDQAARVTAEKVAAGEQAPPVATGTFAVYVTPEKSLMLVTSSEGEFIPGENSFEMSPRVIATIMTFLNGGGKLRSLLPGKKK